MSETNLYTESCPISLQSRMEESCPISLQNQTEEAWNYLTHGAGFLVSLVGSVGLLFAAASHKEVAYFWSCAAFAFSHTAVYASSTFYHMCPTSQVKKRLQVLDHMCIYLLIAGTYTPFASLIVKGVMGWWILGLIWGMALLGIVLKFFLFEEAYTFCFVLYLAMGWMCIFMLNSLRYGLSLTEIWLIVVGGVAYMVGVVFYKKSEVFFYHTIWHIFVLIGSFCHFAAIISLVV